MEDVRALVERARRGETEAYAELVRRLQDMAVGYATAILRDRALAEDAAQESFVAAYRALGRLREPGAFPGWLRTIVARQCDRIRRARGPAGAELPENVATARPRDDPEAVLESKRIAFAVRRAVAALPEGERVATHLFYMSDRSHAAIAAFRDISVPAVKSRLPSARRRLRAGVLAGFDEATRHERPSRNAEFVEEVVRVIKAIKFMLMASDMDRAVAFYRDAVGLTVRAQSAGWSELAYGDAIVALHGGGDGSYRETGLSFTVDDIDAACRAVVAAGGALRAGPSDRPGEPIRLAEVTDPEGNGFMFSQDVG